MKRINNIFEQIISYDNLKLAHIKARKGKAHYKGVVSVNANEEVLLKILQDTLKAGTFTTSAYRIKELDDNGKLRDIYILPYYPDRIVQHAILNIIEERLTKALIRDTFQSITGRGTHDARKRVRLCIKDENAVWSLKLDISKYYPSINNEKLKLIVRKFIKCEKTLKLLDNIIDSTKGLPIGNHISQILGNLYLCEVDWFIKQNLKPVGYFRYCDDMILIDKTKEQLAYFMSAIEEKILALDLKLKSEKIFSKIDKTGLDFVGFLHRRSKTTLRDRTAYKFKKSVKLRKYDSIFSYKGHCKYINGKELWFKTIKKFPMKLKGNIQL